jgi:hypothetical protein
MISLLSPTASIIADAPKIVADYMNLFKSEGIYQDQTVSMVNNVGTASGY